MCLLLGPGLPAELEGQLRPGNGRPEVGDHLSSRTSDIRAQSRSTDSVIRRIDPHGDPILRFHHGQRLADRYRIYDFIGEGATGEVYSADDEYLSVLVA